MNGDPNDGVPTGKAAPARLGNPYVEFYGKHGISPVHQDISNLGAHLRRREQLYRLLGLAPAMFPGKRILEAGPGGGHNALALFAWGAEIDFVEPNPTAGGELGELFAQHGIEAWRWTLFPGVVEQYCAASLYDIVIAEGFIPGLYERGDVVEKLKSVVKPGGVVIVTCFDELSTFFEVLKRLVGRKLIRTAVRHEEQVKILCEAFEGHLKTLRHVSRPIEDWVQDMFLNPAFFGRVFSIADCVAEFGAELEVLGGSPSMFTSYQWYKDVDFDSRQDVLAQFAHKRHCLLLWDMPESIRRAEDNDLLVRSAAEIRRLAGASEQAKGRKTDDEVTLELERFLALSKDLDGRIPQAIQEAGELLADAEPSARRVATARHFAAAFGRGQQYLSLAKRIDYSMLLGSAAR